MTRRGRRVAVGYDGRIRSIPGRRVFKSSNRLRRFINSSYFNMRECISIHVGQVRTFPNGFPDPLSHATKVWTPAAAHLRTKPHRRASHAHCTTHYTPHARVTLPEPCRGFTAAVLRLKRYPTFTTRATPPTPTLSPHAWYHARCSTGALRPLLLCGAPTEHALEIPIRFADPSTSYL